MAAQKQSVKQDKLWFKRWWAITLYIIVGVGIIVSVSPSEQRKDADAQKQVVADPSKVPYESVEMWDIGDNGKGGTIVIDKQYDNEASLSQLGKELNDQNSSRQFAMVYVYSDQTAALYRKESFCSPGQSERVRSFKQHWAATYQKNLSGASFTVFTDRSCDPNAASATVAY